MLFSLFYSFSHDLSSFFHFWFAAGDAFLLRILAKVNLLPASQTETETSVGFLFAFLLCICYCATRFQPDTYLVCQNKLLFIINYELATVTDIRMSEAVTKKASYSILEFPNSAISDTGPVNPTKQLRGTFQYVQQKERSAKSPSILPSFLRPSVCLGVIFFSFRAS